MIKKALSIVAAIAAMAAAAAVCVVAAAFALYALIRDYIGPAGAAAVVAGVAAVIAVIVAVILTRKAKPKAASPAQVQEQQGGLPAKLIALAREKPIIAAGAAIAAGLVLMRNPKLMTTVVTVAMANRAGKAAGREERRR